MLLQLLQNLLHFHW